MNIDSMKSVVASFETNPIQSISVFRGQEYYQRLAAISCSANVSIILLDSVISEAFSVSVKASGSQSYSVTDVVFNPNDIRKLAVSTTSGLVAIFNCESAKSEVSTHQPPRKQDWDSGETASRSVHKVSWHNDELHTIASANQDGSVRIFDCRQKGIVKDFAGRMEAIRDVQFDPWNSNCFAGLSENGNLLFWDRRFTNNCTSKIAAHTLCGLTLAYHPTIEGLIATGSRDKLCKVWSTTTNTAAGGDHAAAADAVVREDAHATAAKPLFTIRTATAVGRIRWRPPCSPSESAAATTHSVRGSLQLATIAGVERGEVSVWNLLMPNMPACVLRGHSDVCSDFEWMDTPQSTQDTDLSSLSVADSSIAGCNFIDKNISPTVRRPTAAKGFAGLFQHVISCGKEGKLLVQDVRNGYFPRQHMSSSVTALSSRGHVAFQRSEVYRGDPILVCVDSRTANAPFWYADQPDKFGMTFSMNYFSSSSLGAPHVEKELSEGYLDGTALKRIISVDRSTAATSSTTDSGSDCDGSRDSGLLFAGYARFDSVGQLKRVRESRRSSGAEGRASDPAVIKILSLGYRIVSSGETSETASSIEARDKCLHNLRVAREAGLQYRAAMWETVLALLPSHPSQATHAASSLFSHYNAFLLGTGQLPFAVSLLGDILLDLLELGDCLHFVAVAEVLQGVRHRHLVADSATTTAADVSSLTTTSLLVEVLDSASISDMRQQEAYFCYLDLLQRLQLNTAANSIAIALSNVRAREAAMRAGEKDSERFEAENAPQGTSAGRGASLMHTACATCGKELPERASLQYCNKCRRNACLCVLCHRPVRGLLHVCPVCAHGGHIECLSKWFREGRRSSCPSGCGHDCCGMVQSPGSVGETPCT